MVQNPDYLSTLSEDEVVNPYGLHKMEDMCMLSDGSFAIADHANGIVIFTPGGGLRTHLTREHDTLAYCVRYDPGSVRLVALVLDVPGWMLNFYVPINDFRLDKQIALPTEPEIPRMMLRWLTITTDGEILITAGHCIWKLNKGTEQWMLLHNDGRRRVWFSHLTKKPGDVPNRYLLCVKGDQIHEVELNEQGLSTKQCNLVPTTVMRELGAYTVDRAGHVIIGDWATGMIYLLDEEYKVEKEIGCVGPEEVYHLVTGPGNKLLVGCKTSLVVRQFNY